MSRTHVGSCSDCSGWEQLNPDNVCRDCMFEYSLTDEYLLQAGFDKDDIKELDNE